MTQIRIDTERAREVGRRLIAEGDRLTEMRYELQRAIDSLDTWAWDGRSRRRAEPMLGRMRPESARMAAGLDELGRKLVHAADTFEQEDNTAARNLGGMSWVDFGKRGPDRVLPPNFPIRAYIWPPGYWDDIARKLGPGIGILLGAGASVGAGMAWGIPGATYEAGRHLALGYGIREEEYVSSSPARVKVDADGFFLDRERKIWPERRGRPRKSHPSVKLEAPIGEGQVWEAQWDDHTYLGGVRLGGKGDVDALKGEAGAGFVWDEEGLLLGGYAVGTLATVATSGVVGSTDLGLAGGLEGTVGEAEAFLGFRDGRVGAKIGGTLVSAEGTIGANVAGWNVGVTGEVGVKFELGLEVGKKTRVHLGPFTFGLNIGEALGS